MPDVGVIVLPDSIRPGSILEKTVMSARQSPDLTHMSGDELISLIDGFSINAEKHCVRQNSDPHDCITHIQKFTFDKGESMWVIVFYSRECLNKTEYAQAFERLILHQLYNPGIANKLRC